MSYNRNLYSSSESAIDAGMIYDQTEEKLQNEINAEVSSDIIELDESLSTFVRPNLLDNWYFVGGGSQLGDGVFPINQRGQTSYSAVGYTIDQLNKANSNSALNITTDGLRFSNSTSNYGYYTFYGQDIPEDTFATYSILTNLGLTTITTGSSVVTLPSGILVYLATRRLSLRIPGNLNASNSEVFIAAKVEIGPTQTLAHQENGVWVLNEIPNWEEEYRKCYGSVKIRNADIDATSATYPSYGNTAGVLFYDKNSYALAMYADRYETDGSTGAIIGGNKRINNSNYWNYLRLLVKPDGTKVVMVTDPVAWRKALNLCYAANDMYSTSAGVNLPAITNGNSTIIYMSVHVDKSMENISTVTVTSLNGWIAGPNGALNNSATSVQFVGASGYTVACTKLSNHMVRIQLTKSSAFSNSVNNSSVVFLGTLTLKFT